ncbi:M48 family metalloprotease [Streptomyces sp. NPDC060198]|uniref:M48 family metalloprotease n=1 Tax=Streptomyces sp. NPDC060198 TaxID=3347070 RepID=UPI00364C4981
MIPTASEPEGPGDRTSRRDSGPGPLPDDPAEADTCPAPSDPIGRPGSADTAAPPAPDDLVYRHGPGRRVYYAAWQRHADVTTLGQLALAVPSFLMSAVVVLLVCVLADCCFGLPFWIPAALWPASGALVFHRPTEAFLARYFYGLHRPVPQEAARLGAVWREVTALSGIDGDRYQLWIEESEDLNAFAAAGHIVAVTRFSLERLPSAQLAAVLAHELGHHTGGHAWAALLSGWYAAPGLVAWRLVAPAVRSFVTPARFALYLTFGGSLLAAGVLTPALATLFALPPLLLVLPYMEAAVGRWSELKADRHAAELGFAPMLAEILQAEHQNEVQDRRATLPSHSAMAKQASLRTRLLATHPDAATRIHKLRAYLT